MANVLIIGDTHCPGMRQGYVAFLQRVAESHDVTRVVHIGDLVDWASISFHEKSPGLSNATREFEAARRQVAALARAFPKADWLIGNHDALSEYKRRPGDRVGHNWRIPNVQGKRAIRHVVFDTNYWKTFVHARLATPMGDRGCLSLFGDKADSHRLFAEHLTAEFRIRTEGRGRTVDEWKLRPERGDNHWFDGFVGCAVAASLQGASLLETGMNRPVQRQRLSFAELQRNKRR